MRSEQHERIDDTERARPLGWSHCTCAWRYPSVTTARRPRPAAITPSVLVPLEFCRALTSVPSRKPLVVSALVKKKKKIKFPGQSLHPCQPHAPDRYSIKTAGFEARPQSNDKHNVRRTTEGTADQRHQRQQWRRTESARRTGQGRRQVTFSSVRWALCRLFRPPSRHVAFRILPSLFLAHVPACVHCRLFYKPARATLDCVRVQSVSRQPKAV